MIEQQKDLPQRSFCCFGFFMYHMIRLLVVKTMVVLRESKKLERSNSMSQSKEDRLKDL